MNFSELLELDFIREREQFKNLNSEKQIVKNQKEKLLKQIFNLEKELKNSKPEKIKELYEIIKSKHFNSLMCAGECVGISGAQAMGEFSTQATLNTFHIAGLDMGVISGVNRFQEIINASKNQKNVRCIIFFKNITFNSFQNFKKFLNYSIVSLKFSDLILNFYFLKNNHFENWYLPCILMFNKNSFFFESNYYVIRYELNIEILYTYFLHPFVVKEKFDEFFPNNIHIFSPLSRKGKVYFDVLVLEKEDFNFNDFLFNKIENVNICGIEGVKNYISRFENNEWFIETEGGKLLDFFSNPYVDETRSITNSIWDIFETFGIEAVKQFLMDELTSILNGVGIHNISLLVEKMTFTGTISGITRYTMRNEQGPIGKASFEESMETFFKAAKYGEIDNFNGISASIIGGKKPKIGTNFFDLKIDFEKLISNDGN